MKTPSKLRGQKLTLVYDQLNSRYICIESHIFTRLEHILKQKVTSTIKCECRSLALLPLLLPSLSSSIIN